MRFTSWRNTGENKKPGSQTGFAIRSPDTLPVLTQESDQMQVPGHHILRISC
jgi:hypothetical protein